MTFTGFPRVPGVRDPAIDALMRFGYDRQEGLTTTALTLANAPVSGSLMIFKNGILMDNDGGYTVSGKVVTLTVAAIAADVYQAYYHYRVSN
jgi:hypothetical protein